MSSWKHDPPRTDNASGPPASAKAEIRNRSRIVRAPARHRRSKARSSTHSARMATWSASSPLQARSVGGKPGEWAYAESLLVDGNQLICTPGGTNATLVALNKKTGAVIWQCAVPGGDAATYASAIIVKVGGIKQYVQFLEKGLVGVDAKTGKFLWRYEKTALGSPAVIVTPLAEKDQTYSGAYRAGGGLVKLKVNHGTVEPEQVYFSPKLPIGVGGVVKVGDYFYGSTGQAYLCVEFANGTVKWEDRALAPAASCFADDRLYLHGENGDVALVEPTPEGYREKGHFTPPEQPKRANAMEKPWTYPVVANGQLYIRDGGKLWCYDVSQSAGHKQ